MESNNPATYRWPGQEQSSLSSHSIPTGSWQSRPFSSHNSVHPFTPSSNSSPSSYQRDLDQPDSSPYGQSSHAEAEAVISQLKNISTDEVSRLLNNKEAYEEFFISLDLVRQESQPHDELVEESLQLARDILEKEPQFLELKNQCTTIRTTELVAAQEKLSELERRKEVTLKFYSPESLLQKLQDATEKMNFESEALYKQVLGKDIELSAFIQNYKSLRTIYHRFCLVHLAAKTYH